MQKPTVMGMLDEFARSHGVDRKGFLCVGLVVTRIAKTMTFPLTEHAFIAPSAGQVSGLGKGAVQRVLSDHGILRTLAEEGGRTSRGSLRNMKDYVAFLNSVSSRQGFDLDEIEDWWVGRVRRFFAGKPFRLRADTATSLRGAIRDVLNQAELRQREDVGTMFVGAVMQHLVGAKLEMALGETIEHRGFSVADAVNDLPGDFLVGNVAVHVTRTPSEALIRKCITNLEGELTPLIVTTQRGLLIAETMAEARGVDSRIDMLEIEQFLATNIYEMARFSTKARKAPLKALVDRYNEIVDACETDPSLRISLI